MAVTAGTRNAAGNPIVPLKVVNRTTAKQATNASTGIAAQWVRSTIGFAGFQANASMIGKVHEATRRTGQK